MNDLPGPVKLLDWDLRVNCLRQRCLDRKNKIPPWIGDPRLMASSLQASGGVGSMRLRLGMLTRDILAGLQLAVDEHELLLGRLAPDCAQWQIERSGAQKWLVENIPQVFTPGQTGHCQLYLDDLFRLGIPALQTSILDRLSTADEKTAETYQAFILALDGLHLLMLHAAETAEQAQVDAAPARQNELAQMTVDCQWIASHPPSTFRQALQLMWLTILGVQYADRAGLVSPGHIDRLLAPYYDQDIQAGILTPQDALALIESLYLLLNEYIPDGLAIAVMVGGRDDNGQDVTNELSYLCLEALRRTRMIYPTVGVCWHTGTPARLTALAVELMSQGIATPAFFGDETIQRGLRSYGVPPEEACEYINSTCVEITPVGSSNVWVASPYFSLCQFLLDEIRTQAITGKTANSFESFLTSYQQRLSSHIQQAVEEQNEARRKRQAYGGKPLQSVFTRDCILRGKDIDDGGARYNWVECSLVGLANLADSLYVVKEEVYHQHRLTLPELDRVLQDNFNAQEPLRQRFLKGYPKYGNDSDEVDHFVGDIVAFARQECSSYHMEPDGSPFIPGAFCWIMHERLGRECGATPDGRLAGFPFADGCGGAQGRETCGPTAAILSVTSWDASHLVGGAAFNMKFNGALFQNPTAKERLRDLIVTFMSRGGFETQVNVLDTATLRQAQANPEAYRDLVVRIGGYSDYFTRLSPEMQAEIILRTEYQQI